MDKISFGDWASDRVAAVMGSWKFLIIQSCFLSVWVTTNLVAWVRHWDAYPFIFLNLLLSLQAAYAAPILQMCSNRQAAKDRHTLEVDLGKTVEVSKEFKMLWEAFQKHAEECRECNSKGEI